MAEVSQGLGDLGGAVSALFGAKGSAASATSYDQAAAIAEQNALIAKEATGIKETQESRQIYQTIGKQQAQVGGAGFAASGTALDLLRSSASQGALTKAITAANGAITENSYAEQAGQFRGMASAARSAGTGETIGGILQGAGGALSLGKAAYSYLSSGSVGADATAAGAAADAAAVASGDTAAGVAAGTATFGAGDAAVAAGATDVAAAAESGGVIDTLIAAAPEAAAAWVVCTELHRQGRMSSRLYYGAARTFLEYPDRGKRGYFVWAIPSVRHLRAHPQSWYSRLMERVFNCRAQYIVVRKRGRHGSAAGFMATHGLYAACWSISWFVPASFARWHDLYRSA